jgi:GNAT superfamily N-acetyltransferase
MDITHYIENKHKQKFELKAWGVANYCFGGTVQFPHFLVIDAINENGLLLALDDTELAGIACYSQLEGRHEFDQLNQIREFNRNPGLYRNQDIKEVAKDHNISIEEVEWEPISSSLTDYHPTNNDLVLSLLAVMPHYRGQGIGKKLVEEIINIDKQKDTSAIFTFCYEGGFSKHIYESFGFEPIFRQKPFYLDGEACTIMGRKLK